MPQVGTPRKLIVSGDKQTNLILHYTMWGLKEGTPPYLALHRGEQVGFNKLEEARAFALKNGYNGIRVTGS